MRIDRTTVPGGGTLHHIVTRAGGRLCVLVNRDGDRHVFVYDDDHTDEPANELVLAPEEADGIAEILQSRPIADRVRSLERRVDALIGERGS
jgi:K+/H+ antiporter YhaU regulatory subunit KhtT